MVRKASAINSIDELGLTCVGKFGNSVEEVIWFGREMAYCSKYSDWWPRIVDESIKELIEALDKAGLIRGDIEPKHFGIGYLYRRILRCAGGAAEMSKFPAMLSDFLEDQSSPGEEGDASNYARGNRNYENFELPTDDRLNYVVWILKTVLADREYRVLAYRSGLGGEGQHDWENTAKRFGVTYERIRQIENKSARKLINSGLLRDGVPTAEEQRDKVNRIVTGLNELKKTPEYLKWTKLMAELNKISTMPQEYSEAATRYLNGGIVEASPIEDLDLGTIPYNCLKRAGVNTVADILAMTAEEWHKVKYLRPKDAASIIEAMHNAGYSDFDIVK